MGAGEVLDPCWHFWAWRTAKRTTKWAYKFCKHCSRRWAVSRSFEGYSPLDWEWLNGGAQKAIHLIIYWSDTRKPLTHLERQALHTSAQVLSVTPREVLLQRGDRKIVIDAAWAPGTPEPPPRQD